MKPDSDKQSEDHRLADKHLAQINALLKWSLVAAGGTIAIYFLRFIGRPMGDTAEFGQFGDYVGGVLNPLFGFLSLIAILATVALQAEEITSNRQSLAKQSFETKFFQMVDIHRSNVAELWLRKDHGRKVFVLLLREWRLIHEVVSAIADTGRHGWSKLDRARISYICLYYGVGPNSSRQLRRVLSRYNSSAIDLIEQSLNDGEKKRQAKESRRLPYTPFEGHQSRLGHYYRHLFQAVCYVDDQKLSLTEKYSYVKTLRAQLSNHEQAALLLNSLCPLGSDWWTREHILTYAMVKNLPEDFFNTLTEIDPSALFPANYFEWQEAIPAPPLT